MDEQGNCQFTAAGAMRHPSRCSTDLRRLQRQHNRRQLHLYNDYSPGMKAGENIMKVPLKPAGDFWPQIGGDGFPVAKNPVPCPLSSDLLWQL